MKIVYLHQYFTTPEFNGGVRSYQFGKRLVESGHTVDLITSTAFFPVERTHRFQLVSTHSIDKINVHAVHIRYGNDMTFVRRIIAFLLFMVVSSFYTLKFRGCDLIYATSTPLTIGVPALIAKFVLRVPLVFEVRDLWPDVPVAMGIIKSLFVIRLLYWFEMLIYQQADKIVVLSVGMEEEIVKKGINPAKLVVVPNASDLSDFDRSTDLRKDVANLRTGVQTKICLYSGTFGRVNALLYFVELAKKIKQKRYDVRFLLIGDGAEKEMILDQVNDNHLQDYITLKDPVSKKELISYIHSVDACFSTVKDIPALFNNSANKFFDALAAGKPIIINHGGWQKEIIEKHSLGLVLNWDFDASADKLKRYLSEENKKCKSDHIKSFAKENYSRDVLFDTLLREVFNPLDTGCR